MVNQLPPEFLQALQAGAIPPGGMAPAPAMPTGPMIAPGMPLPPPPPPGMAPQIAPPMPPLPPPPVGNDPIAAAMLQMVPPSPPPPPKKKRKLGEKPNTTDIVDLANADKRVWNRRNVRMARDTNIFRQFDSGVPSTFDDIEDVRWISAAMSNLVNRLSNMMGGLEVYIEAPYQDEPSEEASQVVEDTLYHCRDYNRRNYAKSGGNSLQRDEFFYLFLRGWIAKRVLPDLEDENYPYTSALLDPATCYPVWGGEKEGLIRMTRIYTSTAAELMGTYARFNPKLRGLILDNLSADKAHPNEYLTHEYEVIEYWDQDYRGVVTRDGIEVMPVKEHFLGVVPFVMVSAVGEPKAFQSPDGDEGFLDPVYGPSFTGHDRTVDLAQKGVSVLHYLINTHRLKEALMTLLYAEVEKAGSPPTIRYRAAQLFGTDVPDIDYKIAGTNEAQLGIEKVEGLPTSPHPTDLSPLLGDHDNSFFGGSMNPASQGMEMGPNASGYSLDTLIAQAKELVLPYLQAFENALMLEFELKLMYARDVILPTMTMSVPTTQLYGASGNFRDLTLEHISSVGVNVNVKVKNINDQNRPAITRSAIERMQAGIISQRMAMDETGVRNPNKAFAEILAERALQHPMVEQLMSIPSALEARGARELADFWMQFVAMPLLMQSGMMPGMGGPPGQAGPPGSTTTPPNQGGQGNPMAPGAPPTGPQPGQGRS